MPTSNAFVSARTEAGKPRIAWFSDALRLISGIVLCLASCFFLLTTARAEEAPPTAESPPAAAGTNHVEEAPVEVFNRRITVFRAPFLGLQPEDRAHRTEAAIQELLDRNGPGKVTQQVIPQGMIVAIDGSLAIILTPADADPLTSETMQGVAERAAAALRLVVEETRESRNFSSLLRSIAIAAGATALLGGLLAVLGLVRRRLAKRLLQLAESRAERLALGGATLIRRERLLQLVGWSLKVFFWAVALLLIYEWLSLVFAQFPYTRPWGEQLNHYLLDIVRRIFGGILQTVPNLVIALIIFLLARWAVGFLKVFFDRIEQGHAEVAWLDRDTVGPTRKLAAAVVWLFALAMAYPYLPGAQTEAFKGLSVLVGLMVSLGASSLVGQAASGLILIYSHTIKVGEFVRVAEVEGTITAMGMFSTKIQTGLGEEVTLSNSTILGSTTRNFSRTVKNGPGFIIETTTTIGYDAPWRQVEAMLLEAARRTPSVQTLPPPRVFQTSLSDFYVEYRLACQAIPAAAQARAEVLSRLLANIQDVFNEHGVQIMSPHYFSDPAHAKVVAPADWHRAPANPPEPPPEKRGLS
jgi:small-conductance mechanosensitive channel